MRAVVFDLDGTLIDSAPDLRAALNRQLARHRLAGAEWRGPAEVRGDDRRRRQSLGGAGLRRLSCTNPAAAWRNLADGFLTDYEANASVETRVYPGIEQAGLGQGYSGGRA